MAVSSSLLNLFLIPSVPPSPAIRPSLPSLHHMEPILATIPGAGPSLIQRDYTHVISSGF